MSTVRRALLLFVAVLVACLLPCAAPAWAQSGAPLRITLSTDKQVAYAGERVDLTISITNVSGRPFPAPNLALYNDGSAAIIIAGMLSPRLIDSKGQEVPRAIAGSIAELPEGSELVVSLQPGQSVSTFINLSYLYGLDERPGDYAVVAPYVFGRHPELKHLQRYMVSNTAFVRVLPRRRLPDTSTRTGRADPGLAVRISAGGKSAASATAPVRLGGGTYLPADAAARLLGARLTADKDRIVFERGHKRLVLSPDQGVALLPSGTKKSGVIIPFAGGKQPLVPVALLSEAFGMPEQVTWRVARRD